MFSNHNCSVQPRVCKCVPSQNSHIYTALYACFALRTPCVTHYMYADIYEPEDGEDLGSSRSEDEELEGMCFSSTFQVLRALFLNLLAYKPRRRATRLRGSVAARSWHSLSPFFCRDIPEARKMVI